MGAQYDTSILDIGSGNGELLFRLREIGFRDLTGADPFLDKDEPDAVLEKAHDRLRHGFRGDAVFFLYKE